jgi:hypothetical protein
VGEYGLKNLPMDAKLLRASQQAYNVAVDGPQDSPPPFDQIEWIAKPYGVTRGVDRINAFLVGETASETILAFRGTLPANSASPDKAQVVQDWLNDFDARLVPGADLPGLVHQGFRDALDVLWPEIVALAPPTKPLYVTGHSKGGSLANLAASRLAKVGGLKLAPAVATFAGAKPGDLDFQSAYNGLAPHSVRYEYRDDIVPHMPPSLDFLTLLAKLPTFASAGGKPWTPLPPGSEGYAGVGDLRFIDWTGALVGDSLLLKLRRYASLAEKVGLLQFGELIDDHRIGDDFGYAKAIVPAAFLTHVGQAVTGVSPVS